MRLPLLDIWFITKDVIKTVVIALAVCSLFFVSGGLIIQNRKAWNYDTLSLTKTDEVENTTHQQKKLTIDISFFGILFWGRYVHDWSKKSDEGVRYPFSGLSTIGKEAEDNWVASLNCPITDREISSLIQDTLLQFNCTPEYLSEARKWFDIVSLANSHTDNQGKDGYQETLQYLRKSSMQYFGTPDKSFVNEICDVTVFASKDEDGNRTKFPLALCGFHNTFSLPTEEHIAQVSKYSQFFPTIVYLNQGAEYSTVADGLQRKVARDLVDSGADLIVGQGAHVVQDSEVYKDVLIVYSMGNFIYDQQFQADVRQSVMIQARFSFDSVDPQWFSLVHSCKHTPDFCYQKAQLKNLTKPTFSVTYSMAGLDNTGRVARRASDEVTRALESRLRWKQSIAQLTSQ